MSKKSKSHEKVESDSTFEKILAGVRRTYPKKSEKELVDIAEKWNETWTHFVNTGEFMPTFSLFEALGETSNLEIEDVVVGYVNQPNIIIRFRFRGTRPESECMYDEASDELEFALRHNIRGVEKLKDIMERLEMEMIDTRRVRKVGNSLVITIPESITSLFSLKDGDYITFTYRFGEVKLRKAGSNIQ